MADGSPPKMPIMLPAFTPFVWESEPDKAGIKWKRYKMKFENFMEAMEVTDEKRKKIMLTHYIGDAANELLETLEIPEQTYEATIAVLDKHFMPIQNIILEVYNFRQMKQRSDEPIEQFNTRLKKAASTCAFTNVNQEVKAQIIMGTISSKVRKHAIQTPDLTLEELIAYARASEISEKHNAQIETCSLQNNVNWIKPEYRLPSTNWIKPEHRRSGQQQRSEINPKDNRGRDNNTRHDKTKPKDDCLNCGMEWHREGLKACKARGQTCHQCGKANHFAKVCMSNKKQGNRKQQGYQNKNYKHKGHLVAQIDDTSEDGFIFANYEDRKHDGETTLEVGQTPVTFTIDSGATVNLICSTKYNKLANPPTLDKSIKNIFAYGQRSPLEIAGQFQAVLEHRGKKIKSIFYVTVADGPSLLCKQTSLELNLIKFECSLVNEPHKSDNFIEGIEQSYPNVFIGIGKHNKYKVKIHVNKNIEPVANKYRRLPFHVRDKVEHELQNLLEQDIIERIPHNAPTPWVSPIVIVPKKSDPKQLRICIDMRQANRAIIRERHVTPTVEDIKYELNGASWFSKLDLNQGYHQLEIEPRSRYITTFATHIGLFRYKRLNFGICSASEVFQYVISKVVEGIPGATNISDDILIYGKNKQQHDIALNKTLEKISEIGITLNKSKCIFNKTNLNFFGQIFTQEGTATDMKRIKAIEEMGIPQTPAEMRSLLGMCNFCSRYIPNLAIVSQPLKELTRTNVAWKWGKEQQEAYDRMMTLLTRHTQLAYFKKSNDTQIWTDASPTGIAAILVQQGEGKQHIISFASRTLTYTESRYSQIEREALAVVWAMEHYRMYILGATFTVITDHKPLISLFTNPNAKLSTRLERWCLKIQQYDYKIQYKEGKENPADYLSRHSIPAGISKTEKIAREYANLIALSTMPKDISTAEVQKHTLNDPTIQQVMENLRTGRWDKDHGPKVNQKQMKIYHKIRHELTPSVDDSILLRGHRIVMPVGLQERTIDIAHMGHLGMTKTKQLIRHKTWFPRVDVKVEEKLKHCLQCLAATPTNKTTPVEPSELPSGPWKYLHLDHKGPLPSGEYILTIIDLYSRFPILEIVNSTSAKINIQKLDNIFALLGTPETVCTDNGSPFNSREFETFMNELGIVHRKVTPLWPQANGEVERFHRTLSKTLQIANSEHQDLRKALNNMLRTYRAAPHCGTKIPPAELLLNRKVKMGIPTPVEDGMLSETISKEKLEVSDKWSKLKNKTYFDNHHQLLTDIPQEGDRVLVKRERTNKLQTIFDKNPYTITEVRGPRVTAQRPGHTITRHISQFKTIPDEKVEPVTEGGGEPYKTKESSEDKEEEEGEPEPIKEVVESEPIKENRYGTRRNIKPPKRLIEECG